MFSFLSKKKKEEVDDIDRLVEQKSNLNDDHDGLGVVNSSSSKEGEGAGEGEEFLCEKVKTSQEEIVEKMNSYEEKIEILEQKYDSQKNKIEGLQRENRKLTKMLKEFQQINEEKISSLEMRLQKHEIGGRIMNENFEKHFDIFHREKYAILKHVISPPMRKKEEIEERVKYLCFILDSFTFQFFFSVVTGSVSQKRSIDFEDLQVALNGEIVEKIVFSPHSIEFRLEFPKIGLYELTCLFKNVSESVLIEVQTNEICVEKCQLLFYRGEIEPTGDITTSSQSSDRFKSEDTIQVFVSLANENGIPLCFKSVKDFEFTTKIFRKGEKKKIKSVLSRENDIEIREDDMNQNGEFCVCSVDEKTLESGIYVVRVSDDFSLTRTFQIE